MAIKPLQVFNLKAVLEHRGLYARVENAINGFNQDSRALANSVINEYKFRVNPRPKGRFGACSYRHRIVEVSGFHWSYGDPEEINATILHEVAHALAFGVFKEPGHGRIWKRIMVMLGCPPNRCGSYSSAERIATQRVAKYVYSCSDCDQEFHAHRRWKISKYHTKCRHKENRGVIQLKRQNF